MNNSALYRFLSRAWTVSIVDCCVQLYKVRFLSCRPNSTHNWQFLESTAAVCQFFNNDDGSECLQGAACPFRHIRGDRTIVCKHWLRGLCKKGDQCEFLHEYDMTKMPECYFYSRFNACHNKECPFLHIDPESKIKDCPWYDRGFCRHGPHCRHRHVRRVLCTNYLAGFCPDGELCKYMHPRFELPPAPEIPKDQLQKRPPTCHFCGELGHKASYCVNMPPEVCTMMTFIFWQILTAFLYLLRTTATWGIAATRRSKIPFTWLPATNERRTWPTTTTGRNHLLQMRIERTLCESMSERSFSVLVQSSSDIKVKKNK